MTCAVVATDGARREGWIRDTANETALTWINTGANGEQYLRRGIRRGNGQESKAS